MGSLGMRFEYTFEDGATLRLDFSVSHEEIVGKLSGEPPVARVRAYLEQVLAAVRAGETNAPQ